MSKLTEQEQLQVIAEFEREMMTDMYTRMFSSCKAKCISSNYKESDLSKGEGVCLDRCVAKYFEIHTLIGKKLNEAVVQDTQNQQTAVPKK